MATVVGFSTIIPFVALFVLFIILGFYGKYWRRSRGNLNEIYEWSLAGRRLGTTLVFFLLGADIYTSFAFVALPSGVFAKGSIYFLVYAPLTFAIALVIMPSSSTSMLAKNYVLRYVIAIVNVLILLRPYIQVS